MKILLDDWQKEVLKIKGNLCLCSGRQVGKSTVISMKAGNSALESKKSIMIIASVERQALLLFEKVLSHIYLKNKGAIMQGKDKPTKHELKLTNGSIIRCLPTGDTGYGIRGYTIDELYADEAHYLKEEVWAAVTPMLSTTGGSINLLSTPSGTEGYFYRCFHDSKFKSIHVSTEAVAEDREEPQRTLMLEFLKNEKERMTKLQYQQEYLGLFVGGIQRWIPDELIDEICTVSPKFLNDNESSVNLRDRGDNYQGIDIARMGGDETVLITLNKSEDDLLTQTDMTIPEPQKLTDIARLIIHKDKELNHKKIGMDDGGLGIGVFDILFEDPQTRRKIIGLNNARRDIEPDKIIKNKRKDGRKKPLLGVQMSVNLKNLMETGKIKLFDSPELKQSLRSMQYENEGELKIYGNYSHIYESLKRAAEIAAKDKTLKVWAR